jgi:DNA-binding NarL/FixJ family response regulator
MSQTYKSSSAEVSSSAPELVWPRVTIISGQKMSIEAIRCLLEANGIEVARVGDSPAESDGKYAGASKTPANHVALLIATNKPFSTLVAEGLRIAQKNVNLVVLTRQVTRGEVYAALQIGAKGYVSLDAEPHELVDAIRAAGQGKVYLTSAAAELLVKEIPIPGHARPEVHIGQTALSPRELQIAQLLCEGLTGKEIGRQLHISAKTVENHRHAIYQKCGVDNLAGLIRHAVHQGIIDL